VAVLDPAEARWPSVLPGRGHYESYYLRAVHPTEPRGVWIRYTVSVAADGAPTGQLWFTMFDRTAPRIRAVRVDVGDVGTGEGAWIRLGAATFGPSAAVGQARSADCSASWSLRHRSDDAPLLHLPRSWMYRARLPRTKLLSLRPVAVFDGTLEIDGESISVDGWPGMIGHNWGEQHAEQWIWLHGLGFTDAGPDTWLDVALGRVRLGPVTTPWVANGVLSLEGTLHRLGGLGRRVAVTAAADTCEVRIPGAGRTVTVWASAPAAAFVEWDYADPDGSPHRVGNCSVADLAVRVQRSDAEPLELTAAGRAAYELGRDAQG
jgi:hypothetical protein